jgi:predicted phage terminase large subunit-like protein
MQEVTPSLIDVERELCQRSFADFCQLAWHVLEPATPLKWGWALDAICEHLQAVHDGQIKRLLMNVPPGCMKSLTTSVLFPAWEWAVGGQSLRYISTSHKEALAVRDNIKCRRLIQSEWYQQRWNVQITGDQNQKTKFENTMTGFREAMAFTSLTGSRGDRIIIDDPMSVDDAISDAVRENIKTTFLEAVPTRVNNDDSAIIVIMQRLHEDDVSGVILTHDLGYEHLMLPMRYEPSRKCVTSIGFSDPRTKDGELLFPERFSEKKVTELEKSMGAVASAGQLQQSPVPRGGAVFKREWFRFYRKAQLPPSFEQQIQTWDMAFKAADTSDFVAGHVIARKGANYYIMPNRKYGRFNYVETKRQFIDLTFECPKALKKLVEDKANGSAIIDDLGRDISGIIAIKPKESKEARAQAVTGLFEAGNVYFPHPDDCPWVDSLIAEMLKFPNGAHDDQVDSITQGLNYLLAHKHANFSERDKLLIKQGIYRGN